MLALGTFDAPRQHRFNTLEFDLQIDEAVHGHGDPAGLLGYDQRDAIGLFGDTDGRPVAGTEVGGYLRVRGQRQKAGGCRDAVPLNDHGAVVKCAERLENRAQQIAGNQRIQPDAALDEGPQPNFSLHHDQRTGLLLRELAQSEEDLVGDLAALEVGKTSERPPAHARQHAPSLGLEHDDECESSVGGESSEPTVKQVQTSPRRDGVDCNQDYYARQDVGRPPAPYEYDELIYKECDDQDIDCGGWGEGGQVPACDF